MKNENFYSDITATIIEQVESGKLSLSALWGSQLPLRVTGETYQGTNVLALWVSSAVNSYTNPTWMTYQQAKKLGGQVRKGETGTKVIKYKPLTKEDKNGDEKTFHMVKAYSVFNVDQIDGLGETFATVEGTAQPVEFINDYLITNTGVTVNHGGEEAYYHTGTDEIHFPDIKSFKDTESYYAVMAHELTHWTMAKSRLNRDRDATSKASIAKEELIAELGAAFICAELGLKTIERTDHAAYIQSWLSIFKHDSKAIFEAAKEAQKAADFIRSLQTAKRKAA